MKIKYNLIYILLISTLIMSVLYFLPLPKNANAEEKISIIIQYNKKKYSFNPDYSSLSKKEINNRIGNGTLKEINNKITEVYNLGFSREISIDYVLCGFTNFIDKISKDIEVQPADALVNMKNVNGRAVFDIIPEIKGRKMHRNAMCELIWLKLKSNSKIFIKAQVSNLSPSITALMIKRETFERGGFSTYCNKYNENRVHNILIAIKNLDGTIIKPGETFSFNKAVGPRTIERGFRNAAVIENGRYIEGAGGGVCQVSTTMYNAALLSDITIIERHRHTLRSNYIEAGFDAMVNDGGCDLRMKNNTDGNIYILAEYVDGRLTIRLYGVENQYEINRISEIEAEYKAGSVLSTSYLEYKEKGEILKKVKIHKDYYYPDPSLLNAE